MHDVIIVGAGFTGLSAALELKHRSKRVFVLEARDRVGGRVEAQSNSLGELVDTGGQFVCDDMPEVMALLRSHRQALVSPSFEGQDLSVPAISPERLDEIGDGASALRKRYGRIDPADPSIAGLTVSAWLTRQPEDDASKDAFRSMIEGLWCHSVDDVPLWHLIDNDRRITNEQYELQHYPAETIHALAAGLAQELGEDVRLSTPVQAIGVDEDGVTVDTPAGRHCARAVLVALPPSMAARLTYAPALPAALSQALSVWRSGAVIKLQLRYRTAFWREGGRSGVVMFRDPIGMFACDTGTTDRPALTGFIGGSSALHWRRKGTEGIGEAFAALLAEALGPQARAPLAATVRDWCDDEWSGGAYSDLILDMDARDAEQVIAAGAPPIHYACSEISPSFPGYIEGALVAGRLAADRIVQSASTTSASGS